ISCQWFLGFISAALMPPPLEKTARVRLIAPLWRFRFFQLCMFNAFRMVGCVVASARYKYHHN
ncbi:MAG: hypothetical protein Q8K61_03595, partial [Gallionella sp.]|nr:hypothetical protein [Gallionella sp.]